MPGFAGFWFSYRTSSAKTSFRQDNAVAVLWQNRFQCWRAHAPCPRGRTYLGKRMGNGRNARLVTMSKCTNFASSLPMSGRETVSILMPFLPEENRGDGPEPLMANGRRLVWRMRYRNTHGAEKTFL